MPIIKFTSPEEFKKEAEPISLQTDRKTSSSIQPEDPSQYSTKVAIALLKPPQMISGGLRSIQNAAKPMSSSHSIEMVYSPKSGSNPQKSAEVPDAVNASDLQQKHRKVITKCPHTEEQYYANGMCKNCYHSKGRTKLASLCEHNTRPLYAKGVCKNCYLSIYHKRKRVTNPKTSGASAGDEGNQSSDEAQNV